MNPWVLFTIIMSVIVCVGLIIYAVLIFTVFKKKSDSPAPTPTPPAPPPEPYGHFVKWVAAGDNVDGGGGENGNILYSYDGICWEAISLSNIFTEAGFGVTRGTINNSDIWVIVGDSVEAGARNTIMWSEDGKAWVSADPRTGLFQVKGKGTGFGKTNHDLSLFVAVGQDVPDPDSHGSSFGNIKYSHDGKNWANGHGLSFTVMGNHVACGTTLDKTKNLWIATGENSGNEPSIMYSYDGISWSSENIENGFETYLARAVAFGTSSNGTIPMWVSVGYHGTGNNYKNIKYSYDGLSWSDSSSTSLPLTAGFGVAFGTSSDEKTPMWVVTGQNFIDGRSTGSIVYSYDGISWSSGNDVFSSGGEGVAFGRKADNTGVIWVSVGWDTHRSNVIYSYDGINWSVSEGTSFLMNGYGVASWLS